MFKSGSITRVHHSVTFVLSPCLNFSFILVPVYLGRVCHHDFLQGVSTHDHLFHRIEVDEFRIGIFQRETPHFTHLHTVIQSIGVILWSGTHKLYDVTSVQFIGQSTKTISDRWIVGVRSTHVDDAIGVEVEASIAD